MRLPPRPLLALLLTLTIALAGCTSPDESSDPEADADARDAGFTGAGDGERPPDHVSVDDAATGDAPAAFEVSVTRADAHVLADLDLTRAADDDADGVVTVDLRFVGPDGHVLLERAIDLHPGESTSARTEASLGGLTNWWNAHPDAEWAPVTLEIVPRAGHVDASGHYGAPR